MLRFAPAVVLIQVENSARAEACWSALSEAGLQVWQQAGDLPRDAKVDVLLFDRPPAADDPRHSACRDAGVVVIGPEQGAADIRIFDDAHPRELALACRLVAEIARLRRRVRSASRRRRTLSRLALTDPLTRLPNRRAWDQELSARGRAARESGHALCVALVDLDHFKQVNDAHGHLVGDRLLQLTGRALTSGLRAYDLVARLGGDEFGVVLTDVPADMAGTIIERCRLHVNAALRSASPVPIAASAGFVVLPPDAQMSPTSLFAAADAALVAAKNAGRDRTIAAE